MVASPTLSAVPSWAKSTIRPAASRYTELARIGSGATSTVHVGRLSEAAGPAPLVAIKRLHGHLSADVPARNALLAQAAVASRVAHPNVVAVRDVERFGSQLSVVMDYVEGAPLSHLIGAAGGLSWPVALRILVDAATGLHAAHRLVDENGQPLGIVHRKISPTKILVGVDGVSRVSGFGVAKCRGLTASDSQLGAVKNELSYMAPEYVEGLGIDARADVFALGVVAWELLTGRRLFEAPTAHGTVQRVATMRAPRLSEIFPGRKVPFEAAIERALSKDPDWRFSSTGNFAHALAGAALSSCGLAEPHEVAAEVEALARLDLARVRAELAGRGPLASARGHLRSVPPPVPRSRATLPPPSPPSSLPFLRGLPPPPSRLPSVPPPGRASAPPPVGSFGSLPPPSLPRRSSSAPPPPSSRPTLPPPPSRSFAPPGPRPWVETGLAIRPAMQTSRPWVDVPPPAPPPRHRVAGATLPPPSRLPSFPPGRASAPPPPPRHATVPPPPSSWWPASRPPPSAMPPPPQALGDDDLVELTPIPAPPRSVAPPLPPAALRRRAH